MKRIFSLLATLVVLALPAAGGTFRAAAGASDEALHYRVVLSETVVESVEAVSARLAATYGVRVEPAAAEGMHGFVISAATDRARLLSNDAAVQSVEPLSTSATRGHIALNATGSWSRAYTYDASGNITSAGSDTFRYDTLGRLKTASVNGFAQTYSYDAFGNLRNIAGQSGGCVNGTDCGAATIAVNSTTNRLTSPGTSYDDAGNVTQMDATHHYESGAAGTMRANSGGPISTQFVYTANDERIATYATGHWKWTVRDGNGAVLRELTSEDTATTLGTANWTWTQDYIYRGAQLLATDSPIGRRHYHLDHLGTPRLITDDAARRLGTHDYLPFGAELAATLRETPEETHKFTGHERDTDGTVYTLDYMHARYYGAEWGRFLAVDPILRQQRAMNAPQEWNRYSYVLNSPVRYNDPTGKVVGIDDAIEILAVLYVAASNPQIVEEAIDSTIALVGVGITLAEHNPIIEPRPVAGASGGPGAGKRPSRSTSDEVRKRDKDKCVFCGKNTNTDKPSNPDKSEIDHSDPRSRGGDGSKNNLQNTCRTCNRQKGAQTTKEFLQQLEKRGGELGERAVKLFEDLFR
jgi:RHS repeat-associated protein